MSGYQREGEVNRAWAMRLSNFEGERLDEGPIGRTTDHFRLAVVREHIEVKKGTLILTAGIDVGLTTPM